MHPSRLYKYQPLSYQTIRNLKQQVIYFGSPAKFNDPYDCTLEPKLIAPSDEEVEKIRMHYLDRGDLPSKAKDDLLVSSTLTLRGQLVRSSEQMMASSIESFIEDKGISCFSEKRDDLVMWSHYGGHCRGICLEFDTTSVAFEKIQPVAYVDSPPQIMMADVILSENYDPFVDLFYTKSSAWKYEAEWRAMHNIQNTSFTYNPNDLTGVYFGPDIDFVDFEIVCLILKGQNPDVPLWKGKRKIDKFEIEFEHVTYTSYIDAKRNSLV